MFLGVSDAFCWLSNIYIFNKLLNDDESPRWGHSPRMSSGESGDERSLPNSIECEFVLFIKTHFYGGHSLHISCRITHLLHLYFLFLWWLHQMETCSASLAFFAGNSPVTAGNSPVTGEFPSHRQWRGALVFSLIYAWKNGWVHHQDAGDLRRHCAHNDVKVMWCRIVMQWSGQPWDLSAFNASLLSNF